MLECVEGTGRGRSAMATVCTFRFIEFAIFVLFGSVVGSSDENGMLTTRKTSDERFVSVALGNMDGFKNCVRFGLELIFSTP